MCPVLTSLLNGPCSQNLFCSGVGQFDSFFGIPFASASLDKLTSNASFLKLPFSFFIPSIKSALFFSPVVSVFNIKNI